MQQQATKARLTATVVMLAGLLTYALGSAAADAMRTAGSAAAAHAEPDQVFEYGRFGKVSIYRDAAAPGDASPGDASP
ncbi:MAG: hypothetical protein ABJC66_11540, partial [Gammaproteobacteria bacterium]